MIVRWGLDALPGVCAEAGIRSPLLIASPRWDRFELPVEFASRWNEVPSDRIDDAVAETREADGIIALGGGSAIDLGKALSAAAELPLVSIPTTYSGAEWTTYYGIRSPERRMRGGGAGARPTGIVYDPGLTLDLPRETTVGTALNALAHCAEALYAQGHNADADKHAIAGAELIAEWLPRVVETPHDLGARTELLRGACHGGAALAGSMLALAHAMAQAVGGRYGLPHGTLNGICLPPALRYNTQYAPDAVRRFGEAIGADPATGVEQLAGLGAATRLTRARRPGSRSPGARRARSRTRRKPGESAPRDARGDRRAPAVGLVNDQTT